VEKYLFLHNDRMMLRCGSMSPTPNLRKCCSNSPEGRTARHSYGLFYSILGGVGWQTASDGGALPLRWLVRHWYSFCAVVPAPQLPSQRRIFGRAARRKHEKLIALAGKRSAGVRWPRSRLSDSMGAPWTSAYIDTIGEPTVKRKTVNWR
jgi:hypothetical protein